MEFYVRILFQPITVIGILIRIGISNFVEIGPFTILGCGVVSIFAARCYASVVYTVMQCPPVRLSRKYIPILKSELG